MMRHGRCGAAGAGARHRRRRRQPLRSGAGADGVVDDFGGRSRGRFASLEEGLVGRADLEGVDDVAVTSGVEAVARGEFLDGEGAGVIFVAFDVVVAVGVEAPHGDFEGGGVVDEGVVGQQAEPLEARQRVVVRWSARGGLPSCVGRAGRGAVRLRGRCGLCLRGWRWPG